ncbi:MAG: hypothetical protein AMXMBFR64_61970 [Myxococcales bacterium]
MIAGGGRVLLTDGREAALAMVDTASGTTTAPDDLAKEDETSQEKASAVPKVGVIVVSDPKELAPDLREFALSDMLAAHGVGCWRTLPGDELESYIATAKHSTNGGLDGVTA